MPQPCVCPSLQLRRCSGTTTAGLGRKVLVALAQAHPTGVVNLQGPNTLINTGKASLLPIQPHHQGLHARRSLQHDLCLLLPVPPYLPRPRITILLKASQDTVQSWWIPPRGLDNINTKSAIFSRKQVRITAFLYATPATQNYSLITIAAIPGMPQNRKCCFIYNKLLGMLKQSMTTQWVRALCTAPNEPTFPERVSDQSKYSTLLN